MVPMNQPSRDPIDGAHLTRVSRPTPPIHRYPPSVDLVDLVIRYWIPVWSLAEPVQQSTLQHPVCLIVVSNSYARFYGPTRGLSTVTLEGEGWAMGTMLTPAAGRLLWQAPVTEIADRYVDLADVPGLRSPDESAGLEAQIRKAMTAAPSDPARHRRAIAAVEERLRGHLPVDRNGDTINRVVEQLRERPDLLRVSQLASEFGLSERSLHRLAMDRVGMTPKWLIQRRRLHDAVFALKLGAAPLADLAQELGYTDQAHFTADFKRVTAMTPGEYLADQPERGGEW